MFPENSISKIRVSNEIKDQSKLVLKFLNKASPIILSKYLVPIKRKEIDEYVKATGKIFPSDYYYWLTEYGAGIIDFINGCIEIPSIQDLAENEGRNYHNTKDCWRRIPLGYAGAPSFLGLDTTVISKRGCCPVVETIAYTDAVCKVHASSWPMYMIRQILDLGMSAIGDLLLDQVDILDLINNNTSFNNEIIANSKLKTAHELGLTYFPGIDTELNNAYSKIKVHNRTISNKTELKERDEIISAATEGSFLDYCESKIDEKKKIKTIAQAVSQIKKKMSIGNTLFSEESWFIEKESKKKDIDALYRLLEHPVRNIRKSSFSAINRLIKSKKEPDKLLKIMEKSGNFLLKLK